MDSEWEQKLLDQLKLSQELPEKYIVRSFAFEKRVGEFIHKHCIRIDSREVDFEIDPCSICYEDDKHLSHTLLPCGHLYHRECISDWFEYHANCPYCKHEYRLDYIPLYSDALVPYGNDDNGLSRMLAVANNNAVNYNILRIMSGMRGLAYAN